MKYTFSSISQKLVVTLDTESGLYKDNVTYFSDPSVTLENDKIVLFDNSERISEYSFRNITTINSVAPTDINDAFVKLKAFLSFLAEKTIAPFLGAITPTSTPTGTGEALWVATEAGTYTNFGGVVVGTNSRAEIARDAAGAFSISKTPLDLSTYQKIVDGNKINTWEAKPYAIGSQTNKEGKDWVLPTVAALSTDVPGTSSKWVERLDFSSSAETSFKGILGYSQSEIKYVKCIKLFKLWVKDNNTDIFGLSVLGFFPANGNKVIFEIRNITKSITVGASTLIDVGGVLPTGIKRYTIDNAYYAFDIVFDWNLYTASYASTASTIILNQLPYSDSSYSNFKNIYGFKGIVSFAAPEYSTIIGVLDSKVWVRDNVSDVFSFSVIGWHSGFGKVFFEVYNKTKSLNVKTFSVDSISILPTGVKRYILKDTVAEIDILINWDILKNPYYATIASTIIIDVLPLSTKITTIVQPLLDAVPTEAQIGYLDTATSIFPAAGAACLDIVETESKVITEIQIQVPNAFAYQFSIGFIDQNNVLNVRKYFIKTLVAGTNYLTKVNLNINAGEQLFIHYGASGSTNRMYYKAGDTVLGKKLKYGFGTTLINGWKQDIDGSIPLKYKTIRVSEMLYDTKENAQNLSAEISSVKTSLNAIKPYTVLTAPNGSKYKLAISDSGVLTSTSFYPRNIRGIGNSIMNHPLVADVWWGSWGMAATEAQYDFMHLLRTEIEKHQTVDSLASKYFVAWETATTSAARNAQLVNLDYLFPSGTVIDLVVLNVADNINNITTLYTDYCYLIDYIRTKSPNATIVSFGCFFQRAGVDAIVQQVCIDKNTSFISINKVAGIDYSLGNATQVYGDDLTLHTVTNTSVQAHPGNLGQHDLYFVPLKTVLGI